MNVTVENLGPCKKLLRIEVPADAVEAAFEAVTKDVAKEASLPGFRPGKVPKDMLAKRFGSFIDEQAQKKLTNESYQKAAKDNNLKVVVNPSLEEVKLERGKPFSFAVTVEVAPEFALPEYRGLPAKRENASVSDTDIEKAIDMLRDRKGTYNNVQRAVQTGDYAVIRYTATTEGKPLTDIAPTARGLTSQESFWVHIREGYFIPGFTEQLVGAGIGEDRLVKVKFPEDFVAPALSGRDADYQVHILEVKEKVLPAADDAFAKSYGADDMNRLREGVRADLQNELNQKATHQVRAQVVEGVLSKVQCDLPETLVEYERRSLVYSIVEENRRRGVAKELIDQQKDEIAAAAATSAKERVKAKFLFSEIATKEGIRVTQQDLSTRVSMMAYQMKTTPQKLVKELEKRNGFGEIYEQLLSEKVVDLLCQTAKIEDVAPEAAPAPTA